MSVSLLANVDLLAWWTNLPQFGTFAAGVLVGCLASGLGWLAFRRRPESPTAGTRSSAGSQPAYDPFVQGSHGEQRRACRREGTPIEVLIATSETGKERPFRA